MKRFLCLLMALWMILSACACGAGGETLFSWKDSFLLRQNPLPSLSREQSEAMLCCMQANRACVVGDVLYTLELDTQHVPVLGCYQLVNGQMRDYRVLVQNCAPVWLVHQESALYYVNAYQGGRLEKLELDTEEAHVLREESCSYLQLWEDRLFFCNEENFFCSVDLSGKDEQIIIEKAVCYPYLTEAGILFQSETERNILKYRYEKNGEPTELSLTKTAAYAPVIVDDRLYYTQSGKLCRLNRDGKEGMCYEMPEVTGAIELFWGGTCWIARGVMDNCGIRQIQISLPEGSWEDCSWRGYRYCDYQGEGYLIESDYFTDARLRAFVLRSEEGAVSEYLYGAWEEKNEE